MGSWRGIKRVRMQNGGEECRRPLLLLLFFFVSYACGSHSKNRNGRKKGAHLRKYCLFSRLLKTRRRAAHLQEKGKEGRRRAFAPTFFLFEQEIDNIDITPSQTWGEKGERLWAQYMYSKLHFGHTAVVFSHIFLFFFLSPCLLFILPPLTNFRHFLRSKKGGARGQGATRKLKIQGRRP